MEPKITAVAEMIAESGFDIELEVDGGVNEKTVAGAAAAGARILVAGSGLYKHPDGLGAAVSSLRKLAEEAVAA
jgi:ribulose-phosphate 3-epimerase